MKIRKAVFVFIIFWTFYQIILMSEGHFYISKYGDDGDFIANTLNKKFDISDLYFNNIFLRIIYYISQSLELSMIILKLIHLAIFIIIINLLYTYFTKKTWLILLFILSSSDILFITSYNMRDLFIMLFSIIYFTTSSKFLRILSFIFATLHRSIFIVFLFIKLNIKRTIILVLISSAFVFLLPKNIISVFPVFLANPNFVLNNSENDPWTGEKLLESRFSHYNIKYWMYPIMPFIYITRPLIFTDFGKSIQSRNGFTDKEYITKGFDTDLFFQDISIIFNMIYLPLLFLCLFIGVTKKDKFVFNYIILICIFSIISFNQTRHQLMFSFMEIYIIEKYLKYFSFRNISYAVIFSILAIILLNVYVY